MRQLAPLSLLTLVACGPPWPRGDVEHRDVYAEALDSVYEVSIYIPPELAGVDDKPWLLVLDGESGYTEAMWTDHLIAEGLAAPHVMVGIGNGDLRDRDYTPSVIDDDPETSGGWTEFAAWLEDDFMPSMEEDLDLGSTRELRAIHGHSYGGLATTVALFEQRHLWSRFGATSPSLFWDEGVPVGMLDAHLATEGPLEARVYMSMGALEMAPMNVFFEEFTGRLQTASPEGLELEAEVLANHEHFSAWEPAYSRLVPYLFPPE